MFRNLIKNPLKTLLGLILLGVITYGVELSTPKAEAQVFFANTRVGNVLYSHTTVGTSTADAISSSAVSPGLLGWKICNDAINTSTYLLVGEAADAATDGVMLDKAGCFECPNCNAATLKLIKVKAQASSNGYSVIQYKQQ